MNKMSQTTSNKPIKKYKKTISTRIADDIKKWASKNNSFEEAINEYNNNKSVWENKKYVYANVIAIIKELIQELRHDILKYLFENNTYYQDKIRFVDDNKYTPFHKLVWPSKDKIKSNSNEELIENIRLTFNEVIKFNFNIFNYIIKNNKQETFLGALLHYKNNISIEVKEILYKKITKEWILFEHIEFHINGLLNLCGEINLVNDKILFIITQFPDESIIKIFNWILYMTPNDTTKVNININNFVNVLLSEINSESDFIKYFSDINLEDTKKKFIKILLENYDKYINDWLNTICINNLTTDIEVYKNQANKNLLTLLGKLYLNNFMKEEILLFIKTFINKDNFMSMLYFLENSNFNIYSDDINEKNIIKSFINNYYLNTIKKYKIQIIHSFSNLTNNQSFNNDNLLEI